MLLIFTIPLFGENAVKQLEDCTQYDVLPTGSMKPAFDENYSLFVKKLEFESIKIGDVIIVKVAPIKVGENSFCSYVCHRVIRKSSEGSIVITKGDANSVEDSYFIDKSMYIGTVIAIVRK